MLLSANETYDDMTSDVKQMVKKMMMMKIMLMMMVVVMIDLFMISCNMSLFYYF